MAQILNIGASPARLKSPAKIADAIIPAASDAASSSSQLKFNQTLRNVTLRSKQPKSDDTHRDSGAATADSSASNANSTKETPNSADATDAAQATSDQANKSKVEKDSKPKDETAASNGAPDGSTQPQAQLPAAYVSQSQASSEQNAVPSTSPTATADAPRTTTAAASVSPLSAPGSQQDPHPSQAVASTVQSGRPANSTSLPAQPGTSSIKTQSNQQVAPGATPANSQTDTNTATAKAVKTSPNPSVDASNNQNNQQSAASNSNDAGLQSNSHSSKANDKQTAQTADATPATTSSNNVTENVSTPALVAAPTVITPPATAPLPAAKNTDAPPPTAQTSITMTGTTVQPTGAASTGATNASAAQQSPAPSHENVLDQVVLGLRGKLDPQNGKAEIRLDPPNLGSLRVSINLNKGTLTAQFETSTDVVRDLLSTHIDRLRSVLEGQGITVDRLAVQTQAQQPAPSQSTDQRSADSSNHDGRSAGGYEQSGRWQQREASDQTFARTFKQVRESAVPIDVLA